MCPQYLWEVRAYLFGLFIALFPDFSAGPDPLADVPEIQSLIQKIFIECQPCARPFSGHWGFSSEQNKQNYVPSCSVSLVILLTGH